MSVLRIENEKLILTADPAAFRYTVTLPGGSVWEMPEEPYVRFRDGRTVPIFRRGKGAF